MKIWPALLLLASAVNAQKVPQLQPPPPPTGALQVYFIDVEGGQATLFVTPDRRSLLVDTGWPGHGGRDAARVQEAMRLAGLQLLDDVLITHYHDDHVGGAPALAKKVPIGLFLDHGPNREDFAPEKTGPLDAYNGLVAKKYPRRSLRVGDKVPGFPEATVVSSDGNVLAAPLVGAGAANPACPANPEQADQTENARSLGFALQWGQARILDLGDLTRDKEQALECPNDRVGAVNLLVVSHHGWSQSSSPELLRAIRPVVAVMDNGQVKGGSTAVFQTLKDLPNPPALYQLHHSNEAGPLNAPEAQIANLQGTAQGPDPGYLLRATVTPSGEVSLWNSRTGAVQQYPVR